ncbi:MAG: chemotaxis protein CheA [Heliobacteriaceae bacterium]|nr:chemotaxis protein CheA [Heliobacteriaceae bacterium]MDD4587262.1 chemotaxis protein CheA [Heliobacteriaceae bacterium]
MYKGFSKEPMLEMFIFESLQLAEQLEQTILANEKARCLEQNVINEIFRIMHTIKGSAAMMMFDGIASVAHSIEDLFYYIRESCPENLEYSTICDLVLGSIDYIKREIAKLEQDCDLDGDPKALIAAVGEYLSVIRGNSGENTAKIDDVPLLAAGEKKFYIATSKSSVETGNIRYRALVFFSSDCEMENIRAFNIVHQLKDQVEEIDYLPADIIENNATADFIRENGFDILFTSRLVPERLKEFFLKDPFVDHLDLRVIEDEGPVDEPLKARKQIIAADTEEAPEQGRQPVNCRQSMISVNVGKLDQLMDMVGELVISEAMVTFNPDLATAVSLDNFHKAVRQHRKIINELQDIVMSIRMVPLSMTFMKMNRIVRDMSKKLNKDVILEISGEDTEVDKNIIEHLSDPLMHLIRNATDHGIESREERKRLGKPPVARVQLEAKNEGGDVYIVVRDDGAGLNKEKILVKAQAQGLIQKPESELSDREIYSAILLPGFSTTEVISQFSGRGVGMDVVAKNIEAVRGTVLIDSSPGLGTTVSLKIPLTLAIISGMQVKVGNAVYIIPITSIKESFKARPGDIFVDPDNNEMIMVRGRCYPVVRLHRRYQVKTDITEIADGIIVIVENDSRFLCLFADALLGEQQVVVKALPKFMGKIEGISGCTLLGNGKACLILDVAGLIKPD